MAFALCYIRKSMVRSAGDEVSPARQRAALQAEAQRRGWIAEFYEDAEGHRSGRTERRPGWLALKARLDDPDVKAIIVESLSRASRSVRDLHNLLFDLERRGIALVSLKEQIDTSTAMGRAFIGFIAVMNQFESDITSERMRMTIAFRRERDKVHFGLAPFGSTYRKTDHLLVPTQEGIWRVGRAIVVGTREHPPLVDPNSASWFGYHDALRVCYELYSTDKFGFVEVADLLNQRGYCYRDKWGLPRPFRRDDVRRMIAACPIYAGSLPNGRSKDGRGIAMENTHPPILPPELCSQLAQIHAYRHTEFGRGGGGKPKRVYLIANLHCGECGSHLKGEFHNGHRYYRHTYQKKHCTQKTYVRADDIEEQLIGYLDRFQMPDEMKARIREKARLLAARADPDGKQTRLQIDALEAKLERLREMRLEGEFSKSEYQARKREIEQQLAEARARLHDAPPDIAQLERLLPQIDQIAQIVAQGTPEQKRDVLSSLFEHVEEIGSVVTVVRVRDWARPFFNGD
jgi:DNA invertase Pin-like site-specific DNA recombinase